jgi:hypothetical protein
MRLRIQFGSVNTKEVNWYDNVNHFPTIVKFLGRNYEWVFYDKDLTGKVDMVLIFSELQTYDPNYYVTAPLWTDLFPEKIGACECGAAYSSFGFDHMRYCRFWKPWSKM